MLRLPKKYNLLHSDFRDTIRKKSHKDDHSAEIWILGFMSGDISSAMEGKMGFY